jgi:hypothetical protein
MTTPSPESRRWRWTTVFALLAAAVALAGAAPAPASAEDGEEGAGDAMCLDWLDVFDVACEDQKEDDADNAGGDGGVPSGDLADCVHLGQCGDDWEGLRNEVEADRAWARAEQEWARLAEVEAKAGRELRQLEARRRERELAKLDAGNQPWGPRWAHYRQQGRMRQECRRIRRKYLAAEAERNREFADGGHFVFIREWQMRNFDDQWEDEGCDGRLPLKGVGSHDHP